MTGDLVYRGFSISVAVLPVDDVVSGFVRSKEKRK